MDHGGGGVEPWLEPVLSKVGIPDRGVDPSPARDEVVQRGRGIRWISQPRDASERRITVAGGAIPRKHAGQDESGCDGGIGDDRGMAAGTEEHEFAMIDHESDSPVSGVSVVSTGASTGLDAGVSRSAIPASHGWWYRAIGSWSYTVPHR